MLNYYCSTLSIVRKGTKHIAYNVFNRINNIQNPILYKYSKRRVQRQNEKAPVFRFALCRAESYILQI